MNVENLTETKTLPPENPVTETKSAFSGSMVWVQSVTFLLGLGLLVFVIYKIGFQIVIDALTRVGWGFLIIVALNGARHFIRALCIYAAIPAQHRSFKYRYAAAARFAGEAVSFMTFTGPFLGEATKAALLKKRVPLSHGVTAVVIDNILYDISVALLVLGGIGTMLFAYDGGDNHWLRYILYVTAAGAVLLIAATLFAARSRVKPLTRILKNLNQRGWLPGFLASKTESVYEIEDNVHEFYTNRRGTFFLMFGLIILSHVLSIVEVFAVLYMLDVLPIANFSTAYIIESLTKVINFAFSFVPGTVGVYEGGNGIILHSLGYTTAIGVTLALVRRGAIFFWTIVGLIILLWRGVTSGTKKLSKREEN